MAQHSPGWKDYYQTLKVKPEARPRAIRAAFKHLALLYGHLISRTPEVTEYSERMAEVKEAYDVLSNPVSRRAYDKTLGESHDPLKVENQGETGQEIAAAIKLLAQEVQKLKNYRKLKILGRIKVPSRAIRIGGISLISLLLILIAGISLAFAQPSQALAAPFKSAAIHVAKAPLAAVVLIEEVRGIAAMYERSIISTAVQSMRIEDKLRVVPAVTAPTNDMSIFPSSEHSLFPGYLDKRYCQFRYTVDGNGIVQVDKSTATTDAFLRKINEALSQLKEEQ